MHTDECADLSLLSHLPPLHMNEPCDGDRERIHFSEDGSSFRVTTQSTLPYCLATYVN